MGMGDAHVTVERGGGGSGQFGENSDDATTGGLEGESSQEGGLNLRGTFASECEEFRGTLPMQRAPKMCVLL